MSLTPVRTLTAVSLLLCASLAYLWLDEQGHWRNIGWTVPAAIAPDLKAPAQFLPGTGSTTLSYASIQERPLFAIDRRQPPPPPPPAPPDPFATIQIRGIFSGASAGILASVDGKVQRIKLNGKVGQWTLKSIDNRIVTFIQGKDSRQLRLTYARLDAPITQITNPAVVNTAAAAKNSQVHVTKSNEDIVRERLRNINEFRASKGLPPIEK